MDENPIAKTCGRCRAEKPLACFPKQKRGRYGLSSWCGACHAQSVRERRARDPQRHRDRDKAYREANRERVLAKERRASAKRPPQSAKNVARLDRKWREAARVTVCRACAVEFCPLRGRHSHVKHCSPACSKVTDARMRVAKEKVRKHRKRGVESEHVDPFKVFERDAWRCQICLKKTDPKRRGKVHPRAPELDHIQPLAQGGAHTYLNTQCTCRACNNAKRAKSIGQPRLFG